MADPASSSSPLIFEVKGNGSKLPGIVYTNVKVNTQFDLNLDRRIKKESHTISITLACGEPTAILNRKCKDTEGHSVSHPQEEFFYTNNKNKSYAMKEGIKVNPPTIYLEPTETIILIFSCWTSCYTKKDNSLMFLIFRVLDKNNTILIQRDIEIKVMQNPTTRENNEVTKRANPIKNGEKKRKADCFAAGPSSLLSFEYDKKFKPMNGILQEAMRYGFSIAKNDEERNELQKCVDMINEKATCMGTANDEVETSVSQPSSASNKDAREQMYFGNFYVPELMRNPYKQMIDNFFSTSVQVASKQNRKILQEAHRINLRAIDTATCRSNDQTSQPVSGTNEINLNQTETACVVANHDTSSVSSGQLVDSNPTNHDFTASSANGQEWPDIDKYLGYLYKDLDGNVWLVQKDVTGAPKREPLIVNHENGQQVWKLNANIEKELSAFSTMEQTFDQQPDNNGEASVSGTGITKPLIYYQTDQPVYATQQVMDTNTSDMQPYIVGAASGLSDDLDPFGHLNLPILNDITDVNEMLNLL